MKFGKSSVTDMTAGSPFKLILMFSLPLIAGNIFQQLYTIVDMLVVGKKLGVTALAALGSVDTINWVVAGIVFGFTQGFGIYIAQMFGKKDYDSLNAVIVNSLILSFSIAVILLIITQILINPFLVLLRVPEDIVALSKLYLRIIIGGVPIVVAYNMEAVILRSLGDSSSPLVAMVISTISNIVLDVFFVMVLEWGIPGAAVATLIAQLLSAIYCAVRISRIECLNISFKTARIDFKWAKALLKMGAPLAIQNAIISFGGVVVQAVVDGFGVFVIAGSTAANKLYGILESAASAYGFSMATYVGQNFGAGNIKRIKKGVLTANLISVVSCILIGGIMLLTGKSILSIFISGTEEEMTNTLHYAYTFLSTMSISLITLYLIHVLRNVLQGLGHTVVSMASGFVELVFRILVVLTLPSVFGPDCIFLSHVLAWVASDIVLIAGYYYYMSKLKLYDA